jgi:ribosomal protein S27AE
MSLSREEAKILEYFMEEKEWTCSSCGATLFSSFDDCPDCPACGEQMLEPHSEKIYICPGCKYMTWISEGKPLVCDTCGKDLSEAHFTTWDRIENK